MVVWDCYENSFFVYLRSMLDFPTAAEPTSMSLNMKSYSFLSLDIYLIYMIGHAKNKISLQDKSND